MKKQSFETTVTKELSNVNARIDTVTTRLDDMSVKLNTVTDRVDDMSGRLDDVTVRLDDVSTRLDIVTDDVQKIKETMVTKEEAKNFLTKEDAKGFATKEMQDKLVLNQLRFDQELQIIKDTMATKSDINLILNRIDFFAREVSLFSNEEKLQSLHINEVTHRVNDHEVRLTALENHSPI